MSKTSEQPFLEKVLIEIEDAQYELKKWENNRNTEPLDNAVTNCETARYLFVGKKSNDESVQIVYDLGYVECLIKTGADIFEKPRGCEEDRQHKGTKECRKAAEELWEEAESKLYALEKQIEVLLRTPEFIK